MTYEEAVRVVFREACSAACVPVDHYEYYLADNFVTNALRVTVQRKPVRAATESDQVAQDVLDAFEPTRAWVDIPASRIAGIRTANQLGSELYTAFRKCLQAVRQ